MPNPPQKTVSRQKSGPSSGTRQSSANANATMTSINEYFQPAKPIDEEQFKKVDLERKMEMMAYAINKLSVSLDTKIDDMKKNVDTKLEALVKLEEKIEEKLDPLWSAVFEEEVGLRDRVNKLDSVVLEDEQGLKAKVLDLEKAAVEMNQSYAELSTQIDNIRYEQDILKGYAGSHHDQILQLQDKTHEIVAKSMEKNIAISGIPEVDDENTNNIASKFLAEELRMTNIESNELYKIKEAFQIGSTSHKPRLLIIRCNLFLKKAILVAAKEYRERLGRQQPKYYISQQLPDKYAEQNRMVHHLIWEQKQKDEALPPAQRAKILVQNNVVLVNKKAVKTKLPVVKPKHMFQDDDTQQKLEDLEIYTSASKTEKFSTFQAYAMECTKPEDAHLLQVRVKQLNPDASHVITAFNPDPDSNHHFAVQDDGEHGAALHLQRFLQGKNYTNVAVAVVRIFGGQHLGPRRFEIMQEHAQQALDKLYAR